MHGELNFPNHPPRRPSATPLLATTFSPFSRLAAAGASGQRDCVRQETVPDAALEQQTVSLPPHISNRYVCYNTWYQAERAMWPSPP